MAKKRAYLQQLSFLQTGWLKKLANTCWAIFQFSRLIQYLTFGASISP